MGLVNWLICRVAGRATGTGPPNLFLTLARSRGLFRGWLWFAGRLMPGGTLPRRETELVILRVAHLRDCRYEFDHHVRLARRAASTHGTSSVSRRAARPRMDAARGGAPHRHRPAPHRTGPRRRDLIWLRAVLTEAECVELTMLATHYEMLATVITALRVSPTARPDG